MNEGDARQASDAELFEQWLEGRVHESDPKVEDLFHRRPQWRGLSEELHGRSEAEGEAAWGGPASEADRRLVAECFAEAREHRPLDAPVTDVRVQGAPVEKRWRRSLLAAAAILLLGGLAWIWSQRERTPDRKAGELLGTATAVDWLESGTVAPDFSSFKWEAKPLGSGEAFELTIWADASGARGQWLYTSKRTTTSHLDILPAERADWPDALIWRVNRVDSSGVPTFGPEWRAQRTAR